VFCGCARIQQWGQARKKFKLRGYFLTYPHILGCIQKFPDWVDNEINNNTHSLRSNINGYGGKTHYNGSQNSDTTAPSGTELYHLQFSLQAASPETSAYTLVNCGSLPLYQHYVCHTPFPLVYMLHTTFREFSLLLTAANMLSFHHSFIVFRLAPTVGIKPGTFWLLT
jgi:hypothetical protein